MHDFEVLERGKHRIIWQRTARTETPSLSIQSDQITIVHIPDEKLVFLRIGLQSVSCIETNFVTDWTNHSTDFSLKIGAIVDNVKVGVSNPRGRCLGIQFPG